LKRQQRRQVPLHPETNCGAGEHTHGQRERITGAAGSFEDSLAQERGDSCVQCRVVQAAQEARDGEEEAFCCLIVSCTVEVGAVLEHAEHPVKRVS
jgi:hypothetical protein